jgi:hypothetical protein
LQYINLKINKMKIITSYPIIENGKLVGNKIAANTLNYSSANGKKKKGGKLIGSGKVKGFLEKSGGIATSLAGILGGGAATAPSQDSAPVLTTEEVKPPKKPMSTTTKVLIGVGVAAVLGLGVYFVMKRNKGK